jgi:integrase/recombinase XerD
MPLFVYARHASNCPKKHDRFWRRCHCPKWIRGFLNEKTVRTTAKTRSWEAAEQKRNCMELNATAPAAIREARTLTLKNALAAFVSDAQDRNLATATVDKLKTLKRQFEAFADEQGLSLLCEVRVAHLRAFRSTWKGGAIARKGKQERLSSFFNFCIRNEWLQENLVKKLTRILVQDAPTDYFPRQEFERIIQASYEYKPKVWKESRYQAERLRTLTLLNRRSNSAAGRPSQTGLLHQDQK